MLDLKLNRILLTLEDYYKNKYLGVEELPLLTVLLSDEATEVLAQIENKELIDYSELIEKLFIFYRDNKELVRGYTAPTKDKTLLYIYLDTALCKILRSKIANKIDIASLQDIKVYCQNSNVYPSDEDLENWTNDRKISSYFYNGYLDHNHFYNLLHITLDRLTNS